MRLVKDCIIEIASRLFILKVSVFGRLFGIDYVCREISRCSSLCIGEILARFGATIGKEVAFKDNILIDNAARDVDASGDFSHLIIGNNCYIGKGVFFDLPDQVIIEDDCAISAGVKFITHSDCGGRPMSKWYPRQRRKIVIGRGSWLGVNAVILNGVVVGKCCVVAANTVVTSSCPDYSVVAGSPARVVKTLTPD